MNSYELMRNADVNIRLGQSAKGSTVIANIDDKFEHVFPTTSRIVKALDVTPMAKVQDRLNGGDFFFVEDQLVDFRDTAYNGFVHTDESIERLMAIIGFVSGEENAREIRKMRSVGGQATQSNSIALYKRWDDNSIAVPGYAEGGAFNSQLSFAWNPFHQNIKSMFELVRLVCTNGMIGLSSFLNSNIPLVNRWEEHLDIATAQIQAKVNSKVTARMSNMGDERATVADLQLIASHAHERLTNGYTTKEDKERLSNIWQTANPVVHLHQHYKPNVFNDKRLASQMPGHLTSFDAWNMATEVTSHTNAGGNSTDIGLQRLANRLVFDPIDNSSRIARFEKPLISAFSDPDKAFFGEVQAA